MDKKYFAVLVRYWDDKVNHVATRFLAMPVCNTATSEKLFDALNEVMEEYQIPWKNVIGYASDTANVMVGAHNSVLSRIRDKQPQVFSLGCLCHLANLCSAAALKTLPISIDNLLIDVFYHFKYSAKRWEQFSEIQAEFEDVRPLRVLKHSTTRWLSLLCCLKRLLDQWPALHSYFNRQAEVEPSNDRIQRVATSLKSLEVKLTCRFVLFALQPINKFTTVFQIHASRIGSIQGDTLTLLRGYLANFIIPEVITAAKDITTIEYRDRHNQLSNDALAIGTDTLLLSEFEDEIEGTTIERKFFNSVRMFYETVVSKLLAKFPHKDKTLSDLSFINPDHRINSTPQGIIRLCNRFMTNKSEEIDAVLEEYRAFRVAPNDQLPVYDSKVDNALDKFWSAMSVQKTVAADLELPNSFAYSNLAHLAKILLVLPHSNADPEWLFSMLGKIETQSRYYSLHVMCSPLR